VLRALTDDDFRLGSIYLRQSRHQEAVLVLDKALKLRERDFDRYKEIEAAAKAAQRYRSTRF
jgi:hypothetical protein